MRITGTEAYFFIPLNFENSERKKEKEKKESLDNSEGRVKGENKNKKTDIFLYGAVRFPGFSTQYQSPGDFCGLSTVLPFHRVQNERSVLSHIGNN